MTCVAPHTVGWFNVGQLLKHKGKWLQPCMMRMVAGTSRKSIKKNKSPAPHQGCHQSNQTTTISPSEEVLGFRIQDKQWWWRWGSRDSGSFNDEGDTMPCSLLLLRCRCPWLWWLLAVSMLLLLCFWQMAAIEFCMRCNRICQVLTFMQWQWIYTKNMHT